MMDEVTATPGLLERAQLAWALMVGRKFPAPQVVTQGVADPGRLERIAREWDEAFTISRDRTSRYDDFDRMDGAYIQGMLDEIVEAALTFDTNEDEAEDPLLTARAFKVDLSGYATSGPRQVIADTLESTNLRTKLFAITRDLLKYGDEFVEPLVDPSNTLVAIRSHNVRYLVVNLDEKGNLRTDTDLQGNPMAYQQKSAEGGVLAGWYPNELFHLKLYPSDKAAYSLRSFLDGSRATWRRLDWMEQAVVVTRVTRAGPRGVHYVDLTGKSNEDAKKSFRDYMSAIVRRLTPGGTANKVPMQADEDYFIGQTYRTGPDNKLYPSLNRLEMLDPNLNGLGSIPDLRYIQQQLFTRISAEMLGLQEQRPSDLTGQDIAFGRLVKYIQRDVLGPQLVRRTLDYALALKGYYKVPYKLVWPVVTVGANWRTADSLFRISLAMRTLQESGNVDPRFALHYMFGLSEQEIDDVLSRAKEWRAEFGPLNPADKSGLIAKGNQSAGREEIDQVLEDILRRKQ
jgi:hypothetical protein